MEVRPVADPFEAPRPLETQAGDSSTTQIVPGSRLSFVQIAQGSLSVTFWQTLQSTIWRFTSRMAPASDSASSAGTRRT